MDGVVEIREENRDEGREELRRLNGRFFVAVLLELSTKLCKRAAGSETKTGHVAYSWAMEFNLWAHLAFTLVIFRTIFAPMVVKLEGMRKVRQECDVQLLVGLICVVLTLSFSAYLRCFVG
ncbi:hypothetical protein ISN45_Aa01g014380 [Arabidopsis thaliana x Arabidopsis arenosa]|uniref:Transmembrane protein n=1 Tax=Arabidopsis thaliana x Arabidopsis arenosa TaxID=1240361 RepID=A0A8T2BYT2_9BRAS|nr:hypothetical protein ISN45_Aa01g014380 [Arabidopsis thaliana x Arabidopsis arenosa]